MIVTVNAKTRYREVPGRSIRFLLRHVAETNDTGRVFATSITLSCWSGLNGQCGMAIAMT